MCRLFPNEKFLSCTFDLYLHVLTIYVYKKAKLHTEKITHRDVHVKRSRLASGFIVSLNNSENNQPTMHLYFYWLFVRQLSFITNYLRFLTNSFYLQSIPFQQLLHPKGMVSMMECNYSEYGSLRTMMIYT